jgi:uncharacterized protein YdbL (DUF1318 family)
MKKLSLFATLFVATIATSAHALDLNQARSQGLVTEQPTGYIAAASQTPEVNALVNQVNSGRKAEYEKISKQNGQPVDVVAKLAAEQIKGK